MRVDSLRVAGVGRRQAFSFSLFLAVAVTLLVCVAPVGAQRAWVETGSTKRVALVIGNGAYQNGPVLKNPVNDAEAMDKTLKGLGFEVVLCKDATRRQMLDAIGVFGDKLTDDCIALVYYSGHGIALDGNNYLLPVDFRGESRADTAFEAVAAGRILGRFEENKCPVNIVILDACRNNPFKSFREVGKGGLAKMDAPKGTLIHYATAPGSVADDNSGGKNGLYTTELLKQIVVPGVKIEDMFKQVLEGVAEASKEKQTPYVESSLRGQLFLVKGGAGVAEKVTDKQGEKINLKARLKVTATPESAIVKVDGVVAPGGSFALSLLDIDKKKVRVTVEASGYEPEAQVVELVRGELASVKVALEKMASPFPEPAPIPPPSGNLPRTKINAKDGAEMILIPAGEFTMGDSDQSDNPPHKVTLSAYYIYKNIVTVGQYEKYCLEKGLKMPSAPSFNSGWGKKDHAMVNVNWAEARAYCKWAGGDLPSEAQWEKAARGTEGRKYPWGDTYDTSKLWCSTAKYGDAGGTAKVGSFPGGASPYGVLDMAGNVWQWCLDWYDKDFGAGRLASLPDPVNESVGEQKQRVLRGGSWDELRCHLLPYRLP